MRCGLLLINLGTPKNADIKAVRSYLREFLTDRRVIDLPAAIRYVLVYAFILPFRPKKTLKAYQEIWTDEGSPLLSNSLALVEQLQTRIGDSVKIALGMRYGAPSIAQALMSLKDCTSITVLPLYPQYSSAATGSAIEEVLRVAAKLEVIPSLRILANFYQHPAYIKAQAEKIKSHLDPQSHLLFTYHGIPERQLVKSGCESVCADICPPITKKNQDCYKAQCCETSRLIAAELALKPTQFSIAFQSRLGKTPWTKPYATEMLGALSAKGIKNLTVVCPSFVTDCLETLEEIGIRAKQQWLDLGGEQFTLVPCLNTDPMWINALMDIIET